MSQGLEESEQAEHFRVLDPANYSDKPTSPKMSIFAGGGFAGGLALGIALTLFLETQDTSMRSERDVELALRLPVLVAIPAIKHDARQAMKHVAVLKPERPATRTGTSA